MVFLATTAANVMPMDAPIATGGKRPGADVTDDFFAAPGSPSVLSPSKRLRLLDLHDAVAMAGETASINGHSGLSGLHDGLPLDVSSRFSAWLPHDNNVSMSPSSQKRLRDQSDHDNATFSFQSYDQGMPRRKLKCPRMDCEPPPVDSKLGPTSPSLMPGSQRAPVVLDSTDDSGSTADTLSPLPGYTFPLSISLAMKLSPFDTLYEEGSVQADMNVCNTYSSCILASNHSDYLPIRNDKDMQLVLYQPPVFPLDVLTSSTTTASSKSAKAMTTPSSTPAPPAESANADDDMIVT